MLSPKRIKIPFPGIIYAAAAILIFFTPPRSYTQTPDTIAEIRFEGNNKTGSEFLRSFIKSQPGTPYDSLKVERDMQLLRNLQLFSGVTAGVQNTPGGKIVTFRLREFLTLVPIINLGGIKGNFWFQAGAMDYNWRGRANLLGGYYRYYDRHSFDFFQTSPYLFSRHWGLSYNLSRLSTIEPAYFPTGTTEYNVDRWTATAQVRYSFSPETYIDIGGGYLNERFGKNFGKSPPNAPGPDLKKFDKYQLKMSITRDKIDYYHVYRQGYYHDFMAETVKTAGQKDLFWKAIYVMKYYARVGGYGNFAVRMRAGFSQNSETVFVPFVLDSYITVRGSGNRTTRGTAELTFNTEHRQTVYQPAWGAVQVVGFVDWSAWRPPGGKLSVMFEDKNTVTFAGMGLRFYYGQFFNMIIRIDYGVNVLKTEEGGIVVGLGQYF